MSFTVKVVTATFAHGLFYNCNMFSACVTSVHFFKSVHAVTNSVANAMKTTGPVGGGGTAYISLLDTFFSIRV